LILKVTINPVDGRHWVLGGSGAGNTTRVYDSATDSWEFGPNLPQDSKVPF